MQIDYERLLHCVVAFSQCILPFRNHLKEKTEKKSLFIIIEIIRLLRINYVHCPHLMIEDTLRFSATSLRQSWAHTWRQTFALKLFTALANG